MLRLTVLFAAALALVSGAPHTTLPRPKYPPGTRIVGGTEVTIDQVPFQISWVEFGVPICGGSIVSPNWVVGAAHCAVGASAAVVQIRSGSDVIDDGGEMRQAAQIIIHEDYDSFFIDYDVCVLRVYDAFQMGPNTAAIIMASTAPETGVVCTASGWGTESGGGGVPPKNLRWVDVPIVDRTECNDAYEIFGGITDRMICAGLPEGGKDSCGGDDGGPLTAGGRLVGITSWGLGCAEPGYPGVYTNVANLRNWIIYNTDL